MGEGGAEQLWCVCMEGEKGVVVRSCVRSQEALCASDWEGPVTNRPRAPLAWVTFTLCPSLMVQTGAVFSAPFYSSGSLLGLEPSLISLGLSYD